MKKNKNRTSMSFWTSLGLSANNLRTKKGRTFMTSLAGSIGIIGIALILALSSGVNAYIRGIEEDTLAEYPLQITDSQMDISSLLGTMTSLRTDTGGEDVDAEIGVTELVNSMFSQVNSNDLEALKTYLDSGESDIYDYATAIEYKYDVSPEIYLEQEDGTQRKVNPDNLFSTVTGGSMPSLMSSYNRSASFYVMPETTELYESQYEVKAGKWPESYDEAVLVLTSDGNVSDYLLYALGLRDYDELDEMVDEFSSGEDVTAVENVGTYSYSDVIGRTYTVVSAAEYYAYDSEFDVWVDKSENEDYLNDILEDGETLTIVGVVQPSESSISAALTAGINYQPSLLERMSEIAAESDVVKAQMDTPSINVLTGEKFGDDVDGVDLSSIFNIDTDAMTSAFDTSSLSDGMSNLSLDMSDMGLGNIDMSQLSVEMPDMDVSQIISSMQSSVSAETMAELTKQIIAGYDTWLGENSGASYSQLASDFSEYLSSQNARNVLQDFVNQKLADSTINISRDGIASAIRSALPSEDAEDVTVDADAIVNAVMSYIDSNASVNVSVSEGDVSSLAQSLLSGYESYAQANGKTSSAAVNNSFSEYLNSDTVKQMIAASLMQSVDFEKMEQQLATTMGSSMQAAISSTMSAYTTALQSAISEQLSSQMESALSSAFSIDTSALTDSLDFDIDSDNISDMIMSMATSTGTTYDSNLTSFGYIDYANPSEIDIYPIDFEAKDSVVEILDDYNAQMDAQGDSDKVITYTDMAATMMSSVTTIINVVTYVLIAFIAVSLIVSCIMISIITQISVMERFKEIGILRAMGASKRNISEVFIAETFIIGCGSGLLGVIIAKLLTYPINIVIHNLVGDTSVNAILTWQSALVLVLISIVITVLSGLFPAMKAAKSDPVTALRTE